MRFLFAVALLLSTAGADAQPVPWPRAVRDFTSAAEIEAAAISFPNSASMQRRRIVAALAAQDAAAALDATRRLAAMGGTLSPPSQARIAALVGESPIATLAPAFAANAVPVVGSVAHARIGADQHLIEGLIRDGASRRLYATSVVDRRLLEVRGDGAHMLLEGVGSLFGGAMDPARSRLWIAAATIEQTPAGPAFAGLLAVDPANPAAARRIPAPAGATPGDVAVAPDGTVYASDGQNGAVYRCPPGCAMLETWLPAGSFLSAQGMAVSGNGRLLYVADYRYGLAAVDRASGRIFRMTASPALMLDGIDGLIRDHDRLIAIQNGAPPVRIVALSLTRGGFGIAALRVVERLNPAWGEPSLGAIAGDRLLYVSDPQWDRYGPHGAVIGEGPVLPTEIREISLRRTPR